MLFSDDFDDFAFIDEYCTENPEIERKELNKKIKKIIDIKNKDLGVIELLPELEIDEVTDIFIRINSKGAALSQADFVMSKIAADDKFGGNVLRKAIDYFCHIAIDPAFYDNLVKSDSEFLDTDFGKEMAWLRNDNDNIYDPSYEDMLRVSFVHMFSRGKLKDLVSLLSGRDFETRDYKESIAEESFMKLSEGVKHFMRQYNFEQFVLAVKSAGFISNRLINSQNALNVSYIIFLKLLMSGEVEKTEIKRYVSKWLAMSILTSRYSGSPESKIDQDIRNINEKGVVKYLDEIEKIELSDAFWTYGLPQKLDSPNKNAPVISTFFAAQIVKGDRGLFSSKSTVRDLIDASDVHHIFPKNYLQKIDHLNNRSIYNQVANYTFLDTPINIAVGDKAPNVYFKEAFESAKNEGKVFGYPMTVEELKENLIQNCIPLEIVDWDYNDYQSKFLVERRKLIAKKIENYYKSI